MHFITFIIRELSTVLLKEPEKLNNGREYTITIDKECSYRFVLHFNGNGYCLVLSNTAVFDRNLETISDIGKDRIYFANEGDLIDPTFIENLNILYAYALNKSDMCTDNAISGVSKLASSSLKSFLEETEKVDLI